MSGETQRPPNKDDELAAMADALIRARNGGPPVDHRGFSGGPGDRKDAYRVQAMVSAQLGTIGAFKTGRKSRGEEPIRAPIPADRVRASPARLVRGDFRLLGIELEIAFLVHRALPEPEDLHFAERARACVWPVAAIEVVDSRILDPEGAGAFWKLADNQSNGALVHGQPERGWTGAPLRRVTARLDVNGETVMDGPGEVPGGDAFEIFCAFARTVGGHCGGIAPGHYVTTGSVSGLRFIEGLREARGHILGLGPVEAGFGR
jgi:2-keto-4-pentenoate hydratase